MTDKPTLQHNMSEHIKHEEESHSVPFAQTLRPGSVIQGRYVLKKKLGVGGFAIVFLAHDAQIDREVAIKFLNIQGIEDNPQKRDEFTTRFEREAKLAARVRHSAVVEVYEYGLANQGTAPYIAMEYLQGHDLEEQLERFGAMQPTQFLKLFIPCVDALGFAHKEGIIHKDLKPSNLFIKYPGERRESMSIVDFGVAHIQAQYSKRLTQTGNLFATPSYIAPEYAQHQTVCPPLDIYQMGLILVEGLTGQTVVDVDDFMLAIIQHAQGQLQIPQYLLDSPLGPVINKSLALDFNDRYQNGFEFADALRHIDPSDIPQRPENITLVALNEASPKLSAAHTSGPTIATAKSSASTLSTGEFPGFASALQQASTVPMDAKTAAASHATMEMPPEVQEQPKSNNKMILFLATLFLVLGATGAIVALNSMSSNDTTPGITVARPSIKPVTTTPKQLEGTRELRIETATPGAEVYLGDTRLGITPLTTTQKLQRAPLVLRLRQKDHLDYALSIPMDSTTRYMKRVTLTPSSKEKIDVTPSTPVKTTTKTKKSTRRKASDSRQKTTTPKVATTPVAKTKGEPKTTPKSSSGAPKTTEGDKQKATAPKTAPKTTPKTTKPTLMLPED